MQISLTQQNKSVAGKEKTPLQVVWHHHGKTLSAYSGDGKKIQNEMFVTQRSQAGEPSGRGMRERLSNTAEKTSSYRS